MPGAVVDDASDEGEGGQGDQEFSDVDVSVLGFGRILVIDQPPDDAEELLPIRPASSPPPRLTGRNTSFPIVNCLSVLICRARGER